MPERDRAWKLREGYLYLQGNPMEDPFRKHRPKKGERVKPADRNEFEPIDVSDIRERFDLPQTKFARMIGISVETLRNWERGRRKPLGPSRALLRIANAHPYVVASVLGRARTEWTWEEEEGWEPLDAVLTRHRAKAAQRRADEAHQAAVEAEARSEKTAGREKWPEPTKDFKPALGRRRRRKIPNADQG